MLDNRPAFLGLFLLTWWASWVSLSIHVYPLSSRVFGTGEIHSSTPSAVAQWPWSTPGPLRKWSNHGGWLLQSEPNRLYLQVWNIKLVSHVTDFWVFAPAFSGHFSPSFSLPAKGDLLIVNSMATVGSLRQKSYRTGKPHMLTSPNLDGAKQNKQSCVVSICAMSICRMSICVPICVISICAMSAVSLCDVNLYYVTLCDMNLCDVNLCAVNLCDVNLCGVKLCDINLCHVNLCDVVNLSDAGREGRREGGKEGRREGGKEGRREGGKEGRREGGKEGRREGGKEGRREGGKEGRREGGKEGRREGGKEGRREGGKEGRRERGKKGAVATKKQEPHTSVWEKKVVNPDLKHLGIQVFYCLQLFHAVLHLNGWQGHGLLRIHHRVADHHLVIPTSWPQKFTARCSPLQRQRNSRCLPLESEKEKERIVWHRVWNILSIKLTGVSSCCGTTPNRSAILSFFAVYFAKNSMNLKSSQNLLPYKTMSVYGY